MLPASGVSKTVNVEPVDRRPGALGSLWCSEASSRVAAVDDRPGGDPSRARSPLPRRWPARSRPTACSSSSTARRSSRSRRSRSRPSARRDRRCSRRPAVEAPVLGRVPVAEGDRPTGREGAIADRPAVAARDAVRAALHQPLADHLHRDRRRRAATGRRRSRRPAPAQRRSRSRPRRACSPCDCRIWISGDVRHE